MAKFSLVSIKEADFYFSERFNSDKWFELHEVDKINILSLASKKIDNFKYIGEKFNSEQSSEFPKVYGIPQDIKDAVCEEAYAMISEKLLSTDAAILLSKWMTKDCQKKFESR